MGQRSLCRLRSFEVTDFGNNCDFLLLNNIILTYILSCTVCQVLYSIDQIIAFDRDTSLILSNEFVLRNLCKSATINHISLKTRLFGLHFCWRQYGSIFSYFHIMESLPAPGCSPIVLLSSQGVGSA